MQSNIAIYLVPCFYRKQIPCGNTLVTYGITSITGGTILSVLSNPQSTNPFCLLLSPQIFWVFCFLFGPKSIIIFNKDNSREMFVVYLLLRIERY